MYYKKQLKSDGSRYEYDSNLGAPRESWFDQNGKTLKTVESGISAHYHRNRLGVLSKISYKDRSSGKTVGHTKFYKNKNGSGKISHLGENFSFYKKDDGLVVTQKKNKIFIQKGKIKIIEAGKAPSPFRQSADPLYLNDRQRVALNLAKKFYTVYSLREDL